MGGVGADEPDGCGIGGVPAAVCPLGTVVFGGTGGRVPLDGGMLVAPVAPVGTVGGVDPEGGGGVVPEADRRSSKFRSCTFRASRRCCLSLALPAVTVEI